MGNLTKGAGGAGWPELPYAEWLDTIATLHMWTQVIGKIRLMQSPWVNHSWHVPLYVDVRGLGTSLIPYDGRSFSIHFDFSHHLMKIQVTDGGEWVLPLAPRTVSDFYREVMDGLKQLAIPVEINTMPSEITGAIRFEEDRDHFDYDPEYANRFWRALVQIDRVFKRFRSRFIGKCSPVHFFWGSFDLALTRFSGRQAPPHPGGVPHFPDWVAREAYSHELSSAGFWPGGGGIDGACFYSYAYPEPQRFAQAKVAPAEAYYSKNLGEFLLPYDVVRASPSPDDTLLAFLQTTYEAAAKNGGWNRSALEQHLPS
ncbi:DUF5996 family protein [uncultured Microbulbifer sp.]|uniref:DUF5996 family protein n=1 Tax=uncultured Microbulbifer sp. TaxID=348147 RepID=UPI0026284357|nr:DUF5996 family protein [uncultured Microbulbifer sp.]